jgi:hypothetical protein
MLELAIGCKIYFGMTFTLDQLYIAHLDRYDLVYFMQSIEAIC